ncbi:hypothetical protein EG347_07225 [Chryseobacterium sp. G0186]|nr:hypothetical protein EG347_07225 [Chryseobacterium sp. G0186]
MFLFYYFILACLCCFLVNIFLKTIGKVIKITLIFFKNENKLIFINNYNVGEITYNHENGYMVDV